MFNTRPDVVREKLYVICPIFNPVRYRTRWVLFNKFRAMVEKTEAQLIVIEAAFGNREFSVTEKNNPWHIQLRTSTEIWTKESLINIAMQHLSRQVPDWKYVAWIDGDVSFARPDWVGETIQQLQHYQIVQMFSEAQDLDVEYNPLARHKGFVYCHINGYKVQTFGESLYGKKKEGVKYPEYNLWHSGYAWAARREAMDNLGGLIDWGIAGAGDAHMAKSLVGDGADSVHPEISDGYRNMILEWQTRCDMHIRRNIGYVSGLLLHYFHGAKSNRKYWDRWRILVDNKFDPRYDLKKDTQGLYQLVDRGTDRSIKLRDQIRAYMRGRDEDNTYVPDNERKMG